MGTRAELRRLRVIIEHKDIKLPTDLPAAVLLHLLLLLAGPEKMLPVRKIAPEHLFLLKKDSGFIPDVHLLLLARCRGQIDSRRSGCSLRTTQGVLHKKSPHYRQQPKGFWSEWLGAICFCVIRLN